MFAPTSRLPRPAFDTETEAPCGTSVAEAREALAFWRERLHRLPWYRRAARAEAREMAARWRGRLLCTSPLARMVAVAATTVTLAATALLVLAIVAIAQVV